MTSTGSGDQVPTASAGPRERVLVAMSGGVDSSVAAALLVEAGHEVVGVTMKTFCYTDTPAHSKTCCGLDGILDAKRVADMLGIDHYVFDVEEDFTRDVIDDFVSEYSEGRTPNPCVRCNANTKFRDLMQRGRALGCSAIATGHYVRSQRCDGPDGIELHRGEDRDKDQAYFLWGIPRELVPLLRFPLGDMTKSEVREAARERGLTTAEKPESQEICFVPSGNYRDLLERRLPARHNALLPGAIVRRDGTVVGQHQGFAGFTVGQRKGLGGGFEEPLYVLEIRPGHREVVVGTRDELDSPAVLVSGVHWIVSDPPQVGEPVTVQIRHRASPADATVVSSGDAELQLAFATPQRAVTPGQSAVVFRGSRLLGGGRILARGTR